MANGAPAWMIAVPCRRSEAPHDAVPSRTRLRDLSTRDKREVASLAVAGLASAICILTVGTLATTRASILDARPMAMALATPPQAPGAVVFNVRPAGAASRHTPRRPTARPPMLALTTRPDLSASPDSTRPEAPVAQAYLPAASHKGPGTLRRVLFGSGHYRVQPFPTASE